MRSRNLRLKDFFPLKTESLDLTNRNSFQTNYHTKTDSKVSEIYLNSKTIKQKAESIKRKYEICSKRKPLDNFLLTSIPSYKSKTEKKLKDRKSFLKIEKEKGYKKYNNYHVPILDVIKKHKDNNEIKAKKKSTDIRKFKIRIPKGYDLSSGQNTERENETEQDTLEKKNKKKKRFYIGHIKKEYYDNDNNNLNKVNIALRSPRRLLNDNINDNNNDNISDNNNEEKNSSSIKNHKKSSVRFSIKSPKHFRRASLIRKRTSVIVLKNLIDEKEDIEQILLKNYNHMKELQRKREIKERKKKEKISKEIHSMLINEFYPVENIMKKHIINTKQFLYKQNNIFMKEHIYLTNYNDFNERHQLKYKFENLPKAEDFSKIFGMSLSDFLEMEMLKEEIKDI
jgi:hypothetical protein